MFKNEEEDPQLLNTLEILLRDFIVEFVKEKPTDLLLFATHYFENILKDNNKIYLLTSIATSRTSTASGVYGKLPRRSGISGEKWNFENVDISQDNIDILKKSETEISEIREAAKKVSLFNGLDDEEMNKIIDAMEEKVTKRGEMIIEQGQSGDYFYVISKGIFGIYITHDKEPVCLGNYHGEGFFGEIALMYNLPRSATVISRTDGVLWALNRSKFKEIVLVKAFKKREKYRNVLLEVELFRNMTDYEISLIADTIIQRKYEKNQCIIQQDDLAKEMFVIESGEVSVVRTENGVEKELIRLREGQYFGELAMVTKKPRQASVYSVKDTVVMVIEADSFERLLGPCLEIIQRNMLMYDEVLNRLFGNSL